MKDYYAPIIRDCLFPLSRRMQKCNFTQKMAEARANQYLSREELRQMQMDKLGAMVRHACQYVPYYRERYKALGINPQEVRTWEDYLALPILTKEDVREHNERFISEKPRTPVKKYRTSGSTGGPLKLLTSQEAIAAEYASHFRALNHWGVHAGDREIMFFGADRYTHGTGWKKALNRRLWYPLRQLIFNRRRLPVENISEADLDHQWRFIQKFKPVYLHGYPAPLYFLAQYLKDRGYPGGSAGLKLILVGGEVLYEWQKEVMEEVFACPVADVYGSYEIGITAYSFPCGALHINDDFVIVEVIKSHPDDEFGQIVSTRLDNWEFPLIRYNVEDLAPPLNENHDCRLDLGFSKLDRIIGRSFDLLRLPGGRVVHGTYFTTLMKLVDGLRQYQVIQRELDRFEILVVVNPEVFTKEQESFIKERMHALFGPVEAVITRVDSIPVGALGKFYFIRSDVR